jgi:hypothetical protein
VKLESVADNARRCVAVFEVAGDDIRLPALGPYALRDLFGPLAAGVRVKHDARAVAREAPCDRGADSARGAREQCNPAL